MVLPRVQLFEFNDQSWAPAAVRDTVVESLSRTLDWGRILQSLVEPFMHFLGECQTTEVLDLGSGAGGPARILSREILKSGQQSPKFLLTDLHPRVDVWQKIRDNAEGHIDFVAESVDATQIPPELSQGRARSIINVLHHFPPELAQAVLQDAIRSSKGVFIAEGFERNPRQFLSMMPAGGLSMLLNPILSPNDHLLKALLTYFSPAAFGIALWDGFVSTLRVYSEQELRAMVEPISPGWTWVYGLYKYFPAGEGYYFYGVPPLAKNNDPLLFVCWPFAYS